MSVNRPPFDNADLRLAMKYATNREQILKALFAGVGSIGNDHPIPSTDPYFNHELPQRAYDLDKAAFYFKKAGVANPGIVLQVSEATFNGAADMAQLMKASADAAKIPFEIKKEPADGFWDNVWLKGDFVASYWGGRAAATQMLTVAYSAGAPWNETHMKNEKFDKLLADAKGEIDEAKRKPYIWEAQKILYDDGGAHHSRVQGLARRASGQGRGPYAARRLRHEQRLYPGTGLAQVLTERTAALRLRADVPIKRRAPARPRRGSLISFQKRSPDPCASRRQRLAA